MTKPWRGHQFGPKGRFCTYCGIDGSKVIDWSVESEKGCPAKEEVKS